MSILSKHQRSFHESGTRWLACQTEIKESAIVKIILRVSTNASVKLLLVR